MYKVSFQTNCYTWVPHRYTRLYPGTGYTLDYALRNLAETGYDRHVNPFMHHESAPDVMSGALRKSRAYLLDCHRQAVAG